MKIKKKFVKPVYVQLLGGLGNQLFAYFAGQYLSIRTGSSLHLGISQVKSTHGSSSDLFDFKIPQHFVESRRFARFAVAIAKRANSIGIDLSAILERFFSIHSTEEVGYDDTLDSIHSGTAIFGYFQTYRYYEACLEAGFTRDLALREPSEWFLSLAKEAKSLKPIVVHVRRGDYTDPSNQHIGVLAGEYFLNAIGYFSSQEKFSSSPVWVFSDSIPLVKKEFGASGAMFRYITSPYGVPAAESLKLMSLGSAMVISNSTFSYWAAMFSNHMNVIAPRKWFRGQNDPKDLIPPYWLTQESFWQS